jgi:hypothetical protein
VVRRVGKPTLCELPLDIPPTVLALADEVIE